MGEEAALRHGAEVFDEIFARFTPALDERGVFELLKGSAAMGRFADEQLRVLSQAMAGKEHVTFVGLRDLLIDVTGYGAQLQEQHRKLAELRSWVLSAMEDPSHS